MPQGIITADAGTTTLRTYKPRRKQRKHQHEVGTVLLKHFDSYGVFMGKVTQKDKPNSNKPKKTQADAA